MKFHQPIDRGIYKTDLNIVMPRVKSRSRSEMVDGRGQGA